MAKHLRIIHLFIILTLLLSAFVIPVAADEPGPGESDPVQQEPGDIGTYANISKGPLDPRFNVDFSATEMKATEVIKVDTNKGPRVYIVYLVDAPLALYAGGIPGLAATNPAAAGVQKLDADAPASLAYRSYLADKRIDGIRAANKTLGREISVKFEYEAALNGFAAEMTAMEAAKLEQLPEVWRVEPERMEYIQTDAGPWWIGAEGIWDGSETGGLPGTFGEGIIVGVIDTGIDPWNPSFADIGGDGYDHVNPWGAGNYVGVCDPANTSPDAGVVAYDPTFPCNDKLIGVWGYDNADANPRDGNGHGSHVASTAAGNVSYNTAITMENGIAFSADISGVAPHANLIMYDGCTDGGTGGCPSSATSKAKDQAILDGVDVLNYSIGGDYWPDPWSDAELLQWLAIREAGIWTAIAAGNDGPGAATVGSPAAIPWVTSVGNLSHNRAFINTLVLTNSNPLSDSVEIVGLAMTGGMTQIAEVVYSIDYADPPTITLEEARLCGSGTSEFGDNPFPPGTFNGEIVVCERGTYARVGKSQHVYEAGAGGFVLAQPEAEGGGPGARVADPHILPGLHIDYDTYQALQAAVDNGYDMGTILGSVKVFDDDYADIMATGSSRGPSNNVPDVIVPSVAAPGSSIWAAYKQGDTDGEYTYNMIGGTSMASPHVAGSFALIRGLHPGWSPAEAQSALMLTSDTTVVNDDAVTQATPFDMGSGRVDVGMAAKVGFVMDITAAEYEAADPSLGGDPTALNTPSLGNDQCVGACSWQRTLTSAMTETVTWTASVEAPLGVTITVDPVEFALAAGADQVIDIDIDVSVLDESEWVFGSVTFTPDSADTVPAHMPIAVMPVQYIVPDDQFVETERDAGSQELTDLLSKLPIPNLTGVMYGLQVPDEETLSLYEHALPTTDFPEVFFTDLGNVGTVTLTVPADAVRVVAEVLDTTSPDLDMLLLYDDDGDGVPEFDDTLNGNYCQSAAGGPYEYCSIIAPPAGTWWVLIINFEASTTGQPDPIILGTVILDTDAGNLVLDGPSSVPQGAPYTVTVLFDEDMDPGEIWYGAVAMSKDTGEEPFGLFAFDVERLPDAVTKEGPAGLLVGETAVYTITVDPNTLYDVGLNYSLTDTLPAGMTLVPGSASANIGSVTEVGDHTILWEGAMGVPAKEYVITDNNTDPFCGTPFGGGYQDVFSAHSIGTDSGLSGDGIVWAYGTLGAGTDFYGEIVDRPYFIDDGFTLFGNTDFGTEPWTNQDLPDPTAPNGLTAQYWRDMVIAYSPPPTNTGVTAVNYGVLWLVEFDDAQLYGNPSQTLDYEIMAWYEADPRPGIYDIYYAFDNVNISDSVGTVGIEDLAGAVATQYAYDDFTPTDGLVICVDWIFAGDPAVITYQATVDVSVTDEFLVNTVVHDTDYPGHKPESTNFTTDIYTAKADWIKTVDIDGAVYSHADSPFEVYEGQMVTVVDTVNVTSTEDVSFTLTALTSGVLELLSAEVNDGNLLGSAGDYVWEVHASTGVIDTDYVFTSTYVVDDSGLFEAVVEESFELQRGIPETDRDLEFEIPVRVDKLAPKLASTGMTISYELMVSSLNLLDVFTVTDIIPAGASYAGNVATTGGFAEYSSTDDAVIWKVPDNVVEDPSFETGSPNAAWLEGGSIGSPICSLNLCGANFALTGDYYLWFGGWGTSNMSYVMQDVVVPSADDASLTIWLVIGANPVNDDIVLDVKMDGKLLASFTEEDAAGYGWYTPVTIDISEFADGGSHMLMLQGFEVGSTLASILVDDVIVVAGKPILSKDISATFDVLVEAPLGDTITNTAEYDFVFKVLELDAVTDIRSFMWLPRVTRNYPNQP